MAISIKGLSKARVLAALYNNSQPQGMGFLHATRHDMTEGEAAELLKHGTYFDYLRGRVMKVDLHSDDSFEERLYDRDNGHGAAEDVIARLRTESPEAA